MNVDVCGVAVWNKKCVAKGEGVHKVRFGRCTEVLREVTMVLKGVICRHVQSVRLSNF